MNSSDPPMDAWQLLESYNNETSCVFATPTQTFLARGIREILAIPNGDIPRHDLPRQAMTLLEKQSRSGLPPAPLMGALPFDDSASASPGSLMSPGSASTQKGRHHHRTKGETQAVHLFIPEQIYQTAPLRKISAAAKPKHSNQNQCTLQMIPEPSIYMQGVEQGLELIGRSELLKIVLSRSLELSFPKALDLGWLLANLARGNRHGYTYLINLTRSQGIESENSKDSHWLIGASPELLVRRQGMQVETNPLAGSAPLSGDEGIDRQRAEDLMNSDKDRREHAVVVETIADTLSPLCRTLDVPSVPSILKTDSMMHLSTCLRGTLQDPETCALSLALALHPTPAICGAPVKEAMRAIHAIEPFSRRYYTGMVGWVDARGDGEWAIAIRCGEAKGSRLQLYAGAGIVAGSTPEKELAETDAKFRTMLKALELDSLLEVAARSPRMLNTRIKKRVFW